jgi:hypothetical protein
MEKKFRIPITNEKNIKIFKTSNDDKILTNLYVSANKGKLRFTVGCAAILGMNDNSRVAFFKLDNINWYVSTCVDGLKIFKDNKGRSGYSVSSARIVRDLILTLNKGGSRFEGELEETNYEYQNNPVYKIIKRIKL